MPAEELKRALQREGASACRDAWQRVEREIEELRTAAEKELSDLRAAAERHLAADIETLRSELLLAANSRARDQRLQAEEALGERLKKLARLELEQLADADRAALWQGLLSEVPEADWRSVRVHPADLDRARSAQPEAEVESDQSLAGGLIVATAGGQVRVDNSLSCRLERAWPEILPKLLGELRARLDET